MLTISVLQIAPSMRAHALLPRVSGRVAVTHVNMSGRMLIGLHLFSRAPGIKGIDMSFISPPEVDMKFSPFGMTITEIPGILTALKVWHETSPWHADSECSHIPPASSQPSIVGSATCYWLVGCSPLCGSLIVAFCTKCLVSDLSSFAQHFLPLL